LGLAVDQDVVFVCRKGNDSQIAARAYRDALEEGGRAGRGGVGLVEKVGKVGKVRDLTGGLVAWSREVDADFPVY
jgi:adenylyltransferase/sulfurtransferase